MNTNTWQNRITAVSLSVPAVRMYQVTAFRQDGADHLCWTPVVAVRCTLYDEYVKRGEHLNVPPDPEKHGWSWCDQGVNEELLVWEEECGALIPHPDECHNSVQGIALCPWPYDEDLDRDERNRVFRGLKTDLEDKIKRQEEHKAKKASEAK